MTVDNIDLIGGLFAIAGVVLGIMQGVFARRATAKRGMLYRKAMDLEGTASQEETLGDYIDGQLVAAAARQEVLVATSGSRADRLATTGFILMVSSVLIPFGLVYLYLSLEPTLVPFSTAAPQRDWHLLLAGVSFGLLFIAAARGILTAEVRQREVYGREVREVAYYGDLRRALGIAQRLDRKRQDDSEAATEEVVRRIMGLLLERDRSAPTLAAAPEAPAGAGEHEFLKIVSEVAKSKA